MNKKINKTLQLEMPTQKKRNSYILFLVKKTPNIKPTSFKIIPISMISKVQKKLKK